VLKKIQIILEKERKKLKKIEKQSIAIETKVEKVTKQEIVPNPSENSNQLDAIISQVLRELDFSGYRRIKYK